MKVAVIFSGHMRTFSLTAASFWKHLGNKQDTKVFIHTWENYSSGRGDVATNKLVPFDKVEQAYKPTKFVVEPQRELVLKDHPVLHTTNNPPFNVYSKWCSTKAAYELFVEHVKETGEQFDVLVSCRSDMLFHDDVIISIDKGCVFTPGGNGGPPGTLHDYFAFGDPAVMSTYCTLFDNFDKIVSELNVSKFRAEEVITHHLLTNRVPLKYCYIEYSLCRLSGEVRRMRA